MWGGVGGRWLCGGWGGGGAAETTLAHPHVLSGYAVHGRACALISCYAACRIVRCRHRAGADPSGEAQVCDACPACVQDVVLAVRAGGFSIQACAACTGQQGPAARSHRSCRRTARPRLPAAAPRRQRAGWAADRCCRGRQQRQGGRRSQVTPAPDDGPPRGSIRGASDQTAQDAFIRRGCRELTRHNTTKKQMYKFRSRIRASKRFRPCLRSSHRRPCPGESRHAR